MVMIAAACYLLPFLGSLGSFSSSRWSEGVWQVDALVVCAMMISLLGTALWLKHKAGIVVYSWSRTLALIFGATGFFYTYAVIAQLTDSIFLRADAIVMMYILWGLVSLSLVYYSLRQNLAFSATLFGVLSLLMPLVVSLTSFSSLAWAEGVKHQDSFGIVSMLGIILLTILLLTQQFCKDYDPVFRKLIGWCVFIGTVYLFGFVSVFWHSLLNPDSLAIVAIFVSYTVILYTLTSLFVLLRTNLSWIGLSLGALALPILLSLDSVALDGWSDGPLSPEAVGLFALIALFVMLAIGLRERYPSEYPEDLKKVRLWSQVLIVLAIVYSAALVWSLTHTFVSAGQAVSISLFVYTVSGLYVYLVGKNTHNSEYRYVGISLLSLVVLRVAVMDFWVMELIWKVITLIGIGSLFIGAALLEKPSGTKPNVVDEQ